MGSRYRRKVKRSPKSDPQQYRLYRMESENLGCCGMVSMKLPQLRKMARAICRRFGMRRTKVSFKHLNGWAAMWYEPNFIHLDPKKNGARGPMVLAHEMAHQLHYEIAGEMNQQGHGAEFLGCYMAILDAMRMIPVDAMKALAERYKLRYVDPGMKGRLRQLVEQIRGKRVPGNRKKKGRLSSRTAPFLVMADRPVCRSTGYSTVSSAGVPGGNRTRKPGTEPDYITMDLARPACHYSALEPSEATDPTSRPASKL